MTCSHVATRCVGPSRPCSWWVDAARTATEALCSALPGNGWHAGTLTTPGLDRGKSCVGLWGVSPRDGYLAHNTTQGTQENLPTVAEVTASIRA